MIQHAPVARNWCMLYHLLLSVSSARGRVEGELGFANVQVCIIESAKFSINFHQGRGFEGSYE